MTQTWHPPYLLPIPAFGGSTPSGNTTTTQTSSPWSGAQPAMTDALNAAQGLYDSNPQGPSYYPGQTYAGINQQQLAPLTAEYNQGMAGGDSALQTANGAMGSIAGGSQYGSNYGNAALMQAASGSEANQNNPEFQQMAATTLASTMPSITAGFDSGNRLDSGLATRAASLGANDAIGGLAYQNYQQGLQNQLAAGQQLSSNAANEQGNQVRAGMVAPMIDAQQMSDLGQATNLGTALQTNQQNQIGANMAQYNYQQMQPYNAIDLLNGGINGYGALGATTTTSQPYFSNPMANATSAATGLGSLGILGYLANPFGIFGSNTQVSDARAKEGIIPIGMSHTGLPLYSFRYKGDPEQHIGLMAQDVAPVMPDAVVPTKSGLFAVDYGKALGIMPHEPALPPGGLFGQPAVSTGGLFSTAHAAMAGLG